MKPLLLSAIVLSLCLAASCGGSPEPVAVAEPTVTPTSTPPPPTETPTPTETLTPISTHTPVPPTDTPTPEPPTSTPTEVPPTPTPEPPTSTPTKAPPTATPTEAPPPPPTPEQQKYPFPERFGEPNQNAMYGMSDAGTLVRPAGTTRHNIRIPGPYGEGAADMLTGALIDMNVSEDGSTVTLTIDAGDKEVQTKHFLLDVETTRGYIMVGVDHLPDGTGKVPYRYIDMTREEQLGVLQRWVDASGLIMFQDTTVRYNEEWWDWTAIIAVLGL